MVLAGGAGAHDDAAGVHDLGWRLCAGKCGRGRWGSRLRRGRRPCMPGCLRQVPIGRLASLGAGQSYVITGLAAGEVVSVQSGGAFSYVLTMPAAAPSPTPTPVATEPAAPGAIAAQMVTWTCTGSPCGWGNSLSGHAVVWPAALAPTTMRLGYTTSAGVYVPASAAVGDGDRDRGGDGDRVCRAA